MYAFLNATDLLKPGLILFFALLSCYSTSCPKNSYLDIITDTNAKLFCFQFKLIFKQKYIFTYCAKYLTNVVVHHKLKVDLNQIHYVE